MDGSHERAQSVNRNGEEPAALAGRLFGATLQALDLFSVYLGDRLGYYRALVESGPTTASDLAQRTGTSERYAREWLEQQAVTGILAAEDVGATAAHRRYLLPLGHAEVLADYDSLHSMTPIARVIASCARVLPDLVEAYRSGAGIPYAAFGADMREGQAGANRPQFLRLLATEWLPAMPDVHARLLAREPARIADIGMGAGWSSIALARAYPHVLVDGFDLDTVSVQLATANAAAERVEDRVTFRVRDAGDPDLAGRYDLACAFECIHDMSDPVAVLRVMRRLVGEGGTVLIVDEKVADIFTAPGDEIERYMYGFSVVHCLPVGLAGNPLGESSIGTGTVMRSATLRGFAADAGYRRVEILPIAHDWFRFYRLTA